MNNKVFRIPESSDLVVCRWKRHLEFKLDVSMCKNFHFWKNLTQMSRDVQITKPVLGGSFFVKAKQNVEGESK